MSLEQVSLWGGDAVFCNLDLRLDVLEQELGLPFSFVSGHIHELQIHVPWTRLNAEPIVITINTIGTILRKYFGLKRDSSLGLEITEKFSSRSRNVDNRKSRTRLGLDKGGLVSKSRQKAIFLDVFVILLLHIFN